jgi:hypothetical protein
MDSQASAPLHAGFNNAKTSFIGRYPFFSYNITEDRIDQVLNDLQQAWDQTIIIAFDGKSDFEILFQEYLATTTLIRLYSGQRDLTINELRNWILDAFKRWWDIVTKP